MTIIQNLKINLQKIQKKKKTINQIIKLENTHNMELSRTMCMYVQNVRAELKELKICLNIGLYNMEGKAQLEGNEILLMKKRNA